MFVPTLLSALALASHVTSSPTPAAGYKKVNQIAGFEGLPSSSGITSTVAPPVPYKGLNFENVVVVANSAIVVATLSTPKGMQYAATNTLSYPAISTSYDGSTVSFFDLKYLWTGCYESTSNGFLSPACNCTLEIAGTTTSGKTVTQDFIFGVGTADGIALDRAELQMVKLSSDFKGLTSVTFTPISSAAVGGPLLTGVDIDRLSYTTYSPK